MWNKLVCSLDMGEKMSRKGHELGGRKGAACDGEIEADLSRAANVRPSTPEEVDAARKVIEDLGADPRFVGATVQFGKRRDKDTGDLIPEGPLTVETAERAWIKTATPSADQRMLQELEKEYGPIQPMAPIIVESTPSKSVERPSRLLIDVTDIQYGFRMQPNGLMIPTHYPEGLDILLQVMGDVQPDRVLYGGDEADYAEMSRFRMDSVTYNAYTLAASIQGLRHFLAKSRAQAPGARHTNAASNHGDRPERFIMQNAPILGGLVPAVGNNSRKYPANSYPHLVGLEELDIEYEGGYPAELIKINDRLFTMHGNKAKSRGSTATEYLKELDNGMSLMFHHTHRHEEEHLRRKYSALGARGLGSMAFSNGCLADINGLVPGYGTGVSPTGNAQVNRENWINGFGIVEYQEGDKPFNNNFVEIQSDEEGPYAYTNGRMYRPLGPDLMPEAGYAYQFGQGPFDQKIV